MSGGVTSLGFVPETVEEIKADIEAQQLSTIDPGLDQAPDQPLGQLNGIFSKKLAEIWEALATAYNGFNRGAAEGDQLDHIGLLTGTLRLPATFSRVTCNLDLNASSTVPSGSVVNVAGQPGTMFALETTVTSTGPGVYPGIFVATVTGPVAANAGTLTVIATPAAGWNSVTNPTDATLGTNIEDDADYRLRQVAELAAPGACTLDAIRAALLRVPGVLEARVFENTTLTTNGDGVPGKAFESVIYDGPTPTALDATIGQTIWNEKPSGIQAYGSTPVTVLDSVGASHSVSFSRATSVTVWFVYHVSIDPLKFPVDGDTQIVNAVLARGLTFLLLGQSVIQALFEAIPFGIAGVLDVPICYLGTAPSPVSEANIAITGRQVAVLDSSRISIVHV